MAEEPKLDWMYAGPAGHVNPEEYLMGRAVDKTFEQFKLGGADASAQELPAPTLPRTKVSVSTNQVDVVRKVQEDPLLAIRKREEERKATMLEQFLIQQRLASRSTKKQIKQDGNFDSSKKEPTSQDLDNILAKKLLKYSASTKNKSLDERLTEKLMQKLKSSSKRKSATPSSSSSSSTSSSDSDGETKSNITGKSHSTDKVVKTKLASSDVVQDFKDTDRPSSYSSRPKDRGETSRTFNRFDHRRHQRSRSRSRRSRSRSRSRSRGREGYRRKTQELHGYRERTTRYDDTRRSSRDSYPKASNSSQRYSGIKRNEESSTASNSRYSKNRQMPRLTEEELERRRQEMMQQAVVRDEERKNKVEKYRKEVADEDAQLSAERPKEAAFVRRELATITEQTTVEARVKANVYNIQRSQNSMDSNFARR